MKEKLDKQLVQDYPLLYSDRYVGMRSTAMCWGFECGDGWEPLIRNLSKRLEKYIAALPLPTEKQKEYFGGNGLPRATQVKEKFGTLRFYMTHSTMKMDRAIRKAEKMSQYICENCGQPGKLYTDGWCMVRCDNCYKSDKD